MKRVINIIQEKRVLGKEASTGSRIQGQSQVINKAINANGQQLASEKEYLNIFHDTFFVAGKNFGSKALALPLAIFIHLLFVALLIGLPLMSAGSLPPAQVYSAFLAPVPSPSPPPPPPGPKPARGGSKRISSIQNKPVVEPGKLIIPVEIPDKVADEEVTNFSIPGGVEGGVPGGVSGGMVSDLVSQIICQPIGQTEEPVRAIGEVQAPRLKRRVEPIYPEIAREARKEGIVILEATTDVYGRVQSVRVLRSEPLLDEAAIEAVRQWVYEPMIINGRPRAVTFTVTIIFKLQK